MQVALLLSFNDEKGIECSRCMLCGTKGLDLNGETVMACYGLSRRLKCPDEGRRVDCPLIPVGEE